MFGHAPSGKVLWVVRFGDLELTPDATARLVASLEELGEERLAFRITREVSVNGAELLLTPGDGATILRALDTTRIPELAGLARVLEQQLHSLEPTPLTRGDRTKLRETRMAANEAFFRSVNERLESGTPDTRPLIVLCECADENCTQRLGLARSEYEEVRSDPTHFVVGHEHAEPEIEEVLRRTDRFEVVRKIGVGAEIAARLDP